MNKSALATAGFGGAAGIVFFIVAEPLLAPDGAKSHHKINGECHRLVKTRADDRPVQKPTENCYIAVDG